MKKTAIIFLALCLVLPAAFPAHAKNQNHWGDWAWKSTSAVEDNPGIMHTIWESERPPYGPYDKIALHRFVYVGKSPEKMPKKDRVMFHLPGTWDTAWKGVTQPDFENHLFFANNGYDVFSMDYRVSYLPELPLDRFDASSTAGWSYGVFREDIKAGVELAKKLSGSKKVFMSGFSRGGTQMWIYASKYGEDLKGLIGLDGGAPFPLATAPRSQAQYDAAVGAFLAAPVPRLTPSTTFEGYNRILFAGRLPDTTLVPGYRTLEECLLESVYYPTYGPPPAGTSLDTVSDLMAYFYNFAWNDRFGPTPVTAYGILTNYFEGMIDKYTLMKAEAGMALYWPAIQNIERENDPGYGDNIAQITLPVIYFGGILGCGYYGERCTVPGLPYKCAGSDVTVITLPAFGHMDVMWGIHSRNEVKEPLLRWMEDRK